MNDPARLNLPERGDDMDLAKSVLPPRTDQQVDVDGAPRAEPVPFEDFANDPQSMAAFTAADAGEIQTIGSDEEIGDGSIAEYDPLQDPFSEEYAKRLEATENGIDPEDDDPFAEQDKIDRQQAMNEEIKSVYESHNDWDGWVKDKSINTGLLDDPEEAKQEIRNSRYIAARIKAEGITGVDLSDPDTYDYWRSKVAESDFEGVGMDDDAAFHQQVAGKAQLFQHSKQFEKDLAKRAFDSILLNRGGEHGFRKFLTENSEHPGFNSEKEKEYYEHWSSIADNYERFPKEFRQPMNKILLSFQSIGEGEGKDWGDQANVMQDTLMEIPDENFGDAVMMLQVYTQFLDPVDRRDFWETMSTTFTRRMEDFVTSTGQAATLRGLEQRQLGDLTPMGMNDAPRMLKPISKEERQSRESATEEYRKYLGRRAIIKQAFNGYDEIEGNKFAKFLGSAGATTMSSISMTLPVIGSGNMFLSMEGSVRESLFLDHIAHQQKLMAAGEINAIDEVAAGQYSDNLKTVVAIPQTALEKAQNLISVRGKMPKGMKWVDKAFDKIDNMVVNRAARFVGKAALATGAETSIEVLQNLTETTVQDIATVFSEEMPEVDWGKELKGQWNSLHELAGEMVFLSLLSAAGGRSPRAQHRAWRDTKELHKRIHGWKQSTIDNINKAAAEAEKTGNYSGFSRKLDAAGKERDADGPEAQAAIDEHKEIVAQNKAYQERQAKAVEAAENQDMPVFEMDGAGFSVIDRKSGETLGSGLSSRMAIELAQRHYAHMEEMSEAETAELAGMLISQEGSTIEGGKAEIAVDETGLASKVAKEMGPDAEVRMQQEIDRANEQGADLTPETTAVFGVNFEADYGRGKGKQVVTKIFKGGSLLTVFHEEAHSYLRKSLANGRMTKEGVADFFKGLDKGVKNKFLPANFDKMSEQEQMTALDEATAELMEVEILRTRKKGGMKGNIEADAIRRGMTATMQNKASNAGKVASNMAKIIWAAKKFWKIQFARLAQIKKGMRDGTIDESKLDDFVNKLYGIEAQAEFDKKVDQEVKELSRPERKPRSKRQKPFKFKKSGETKQKIFEDQPIIQSIQAQGKILSKSSAVKALGADRAKENASEWDDAPAYNQVMNVIYGSDGVTPSTMAQALHDEGQLPEPRADALWSAIAEAYNIADQGGEGAARDLQEAQDEEFLVAIESGGSQMVVTENLVEGDILVIDGNDVTVTSAGSGSVTIDGGGRYGTQNITSSEIYVDELVAANPQEEYSDTPFSLGPVTPQMDQEYMAAVEAGDTAKAQEMVDKAAKEAGYDRGPLYHGTTAKFNVFDIDKLGTQGRFEGTGFYFTDDKSIADGYTSAWEGRERRSGEVIEAYLKMEKPAAYDEASVKGDDLRNALWRIAEIENEYDPETSIDDGYLANFGGLESAVDLVSQDETLLDQMGGLLGAGVLPEHVNQGFYEATGYDGIISSGYSGNSDGVGGNIHVAFFPSQIKRADPVTRDDAGNVIPLSERFNEQSDDIRFSIGEAPQEWNISSTEVERAMDLMYNRYYMSDPDVSREDYRKLDSYTIGLELESDFDIYKKFQDRMPDDSIMSELVDAYQAGLLPKTVSKPEGTKPIKQDRIDFSARKELGAPRKIRQSTAKTISKHWDIANQRKTKANSKNVDKSRHKLFVHYALYGAEGTGINEKEWVKKLRSWGNVSKQSIQDHKNLNSEAQDLGSWDGIINSSILNPKRLETSDVDKAVGDIEAPEKSWGTPDGERMRDYIMRTILAVDTRISWKGVNFKVDSMLSPRGLFESSKRLITIRENSRHTVAHEMGHYLDSMWAEEATGNITNKASEVLQSYNKELISGNTSPEFLQWMQRFHEFVSDLVERADSSASKSSRQSADYLQKRPEVFARFFDKFVRWTVEKSGMREWGEDNYVQDKFHEYDYRKFVKLLQEKSYVDEKIKQDSASFSLGPAEMATGLLDSAQRRMMKSPEYQMAFFENLTKRLNAIKAFIENRGTAYNFDAFGKEFEGKFSDEKEGILNALAMMEAIQKSLPPDLRGRLGGGALSLAKQNTPEKQLEYLKGRVKAASVLVDKWMDKEMDKALDKLFKREQVKKNTAGKKPVGKAGADIHEIFKSLREARDMSQSQIDEKTNGILMQLEGEGYDTAEMEAMKRMELNLLGLVGNWREATVERKRQAVREATQAFEAGYYTFQLQKLMEREDREITREALRESTGKTGHGSEHDAQELKDQGLVGKTKEYMLDLLPYEDLLGFLFGKDSAIVKKWVDMERKASNFKEDFEQKRMEALDDLFTKLAKGDRFKGEKLRWKMGAKKTIKVQGRQLSELEALSVTMMWMQEDGRRHMIGKKDENGKPTGDWHYGQDFVDEVEAKLSEEAKAVRAHLMEVYGKEHGEINPTFRKLNGINLPSIDLFSPITAKPQNQGNEGMADPTTGFAMGKGSATPSSLRTRGSAIAEPEFRDVIQTFITHTKQIGHYLGYAPMMKEISPVIRNRDLANSVEAAAGKQARIILQKWEEYFNQGGVMDAAAHLAIQRKLGKMVGNAAGAILVGRISVLMIQSTQLMASIAEMPVGSFLFRFSKLMTGQMGWGNAFKSEYIQRRMKEQPVSVREAMKGLEASKPNRLTYWQQKAGRSIAGMDALMTAGTYAIIYDFKLKEAKNQGLTGKEAEAYAANEAERSTDRVAQPTRAGARSIFENNATNPIARIGWAFASEARQKLALGLYRAGSKQRSLGEKGRALAVTWLVGGAFAAIVRSVWRDIKDDEDDELFDERNWNPKRLILASLTGPMQGVPFLGEALETGIWRVTGEYRPGGDMLSAIPDAIEAMADIDEFTEQDIEATMKDVETILSGGALLNETVGAAASLSHLVRDLYRAIDANLPE